MREMAGFLTAVPRGIGELSFLRLSGVLLAELFALLGVDPAGVASLNSCELLLLNRLVPRRDSAV